MCVTVCVLVCFFKVIIKLLNLLKLLNLHYSDDWMDGWKEEGIQLLSDFYKHRSSIFCNQQKPQNLMWIIWSWMHSNETSLIVFFTVSRASNLQCTFKNFAHKTENYTNHYIE